MEKKVENPARRKYGETPIAKVVVKPKTGETIGQTPPPKVAPKKK